MNSEAKAFLKNFRFDELKKYNMSLVLYADNTLVHEIKLWYLDIDFDGLEKGRYYTREELGL